MDKNNKIIFILDASDRKSEEFKSMLLSVKRLIEDIPDNTTVGIVMFDNRTRIQKNLIKITDRITRNEMLSNVTELDIAGIDIESGIKAGLNFLDSDRKAGPTTFVLIVRETDRNGEDYCKKVIPVLKDNQIRMVCIAIGAKADENLELLAKETNGMAYSVSDSDKIRYSFLSDISTDPNEMVTVCDEIIQTRDISFRRAIIIDEDIGKNAVFTIWSKNIEFIQCSIESPIKLELTRQETLKRLTLKQDQLAHTNWILEFFNHSKAISVNILVRCEPLNKNPVRMYATIIEANVYNPSLPIILVELTKGNNVIVGADVSATVDCPDGNRKKIKLKFNNNVYCCYFNEFRGQGHYNVTAFARFNSNEDCCIMTQTNQLVNDTVPHFERQQNAGCFYLKECMDSVFDLETDNELKQKLSDFSNTWKLRSMAIKSQSTAPNKPRTPAIYSPLVRVGAPTPRPIEKSRIYAPTPISMVVVPSTSSNISNTSPPVPSVRVPQLLKPITPQNLVPQPITRKVVPNNSNINISDLEETVLLTLLKVKRCLSSTKITETERNDMKSTILTIDSYLSTKNKTIEQLKQYLNQLNNMLDQLL